jgi:hypothetical protein
MKWRFDIEAERSQKVVGVREHAVGGKKEND